MRTENNSSLSLAHFRIAPVEILFIALCTLGLVSFHVDHHRWGILAISGGLWVLSQVVQTLSPLRASALILFCSYSALQATSFIPYLRNWPFDLFLVALLGWTLIVKLHGNQSPPDFSLRLRLRHSSKELLSLAMILLPTLVTLIAYFYAHSNIADQFPVPDVPLWLLPVLIVVASALNGLREELLYRHVLLRTFSADLSAGAAILTQGIAFGFLHFQNGFPQGWTGVGLTALFGLALGVQYHFTRSFALTWLTHSLADAIMFTVILFARTAH